MEIISRENGGIPTIGSIFVPFRWDSRSHWEFYSYGHL